MSWFKLSSNEVSGIGIVAGTAIGASMISLPLVSGVAGFWPATGVMIASYAYAIITLLLILEVTLYSRNPDANIQSIAREHLGRVGEVIAWTAYIFLLYVISTSYIAGCGELFYDMIGGSRGPLSQSWCIVIFTIAFGFVAFRGVSLLDKINQLLLIGMMASYIGLLFAVSPYVKLEYLSGGNISFLASSIPVTVTAFASHFVVPSLRKNFSQSALSLKKMIWIGSTIPLAIYLVYEFMLVAIFPYSGNEGLLAVASSASPLAKLQQVLGRSEGSYLPFLISAFSNCAILTSFLGVAISISDFLQAGLGIKDNMPFKSLLIALITLGPPMFLALIIPEDSPGFIIAQDYSGLLLVFIFGILTTLMAWRARYYTQLQSEYRIPGGKLGLIVIFIVSLGIIYTVLGNSFKWLPSPRP
ncbi:MAG: aromatic amino acid transport family protein [Pseudomonadota bacterium]|nr:aromatic amino acid transport family protein [Pseudomonadota bacterium]